MFNFCTLTKRVPQNLQQLARAWDYQATAGVSPQMANLLMVTSQPNPALVHIPILCWSLYFLEGREQKRIVFGRISCQMVSRNILWQCHKMPVYNSVSCQFQLTCAQPPFLERCPDQKQKLASQMESRLTHVFARQICPTHTQHNTMQIELCGLRKCLAST